MTPKVFKSKITVFLCFLILVFSFFGIFSVVIVKAASYTNVSVHTAHDMINNHNQYPSLVILDVREKYEYDINHINNSILIPLGQINSRIDELEPYNDTEIIVYCRSGSRSASASQNLASNHNFTKIFNMEPGINGWITAGYLVIEGSIELPPIDFSFTFFILFLFGTMFILLLYLKKRNFKK